MKVYEQRLPQRVHAVTLFNASDVPASRKLQGAAGHSHRVHPCSFCHITLDKIDSKEGYDIMSSMFSCIKSYEPNILETLDFVPKEDFTQLGHAEQSRRATTDKARTTILDKTGARYSCLNDIPSWRPVTGAVLDYMHNFYGQSIKFICEDYF